MLKLKIHKMGKEKYIMYKGKFFFSWFSTRILDMILADYSVAC